MRRGEIRKVDEERGEIRKVDEERRDKEGG